MAGGKRKGGALAGVVDDNLDLAADIDSAELAAGHAGHQAGAFAGAGAGHDVSAAPVSLPLPR